MQMNLENRKRIYYTDCKRLIIKAEREGPNQRAVKENDEISCKIIGGRDEKTDFRHFIPVSFFIYLEFYTHSIVF